MRDKDGSRDPTGASRYLLPAKMISIANNATVMIKLWLLERKIAILLFLCYRAETSRTGSYISNITSVDRRWQKS